MPCFRRFATRLFANAIAEALHFAQTTESGISMADPHTESNP
jgi:hypothetical protein